MGSVSSYEAVKRARQQVDKRRLDPKDIWGIPYGYHSLDIATGGINHEEQKDYILFGARSGVGKSSFLLTIALAVAVYFMRSKEFEVRIILLEMNAATCQLRLASQMTGVDIRLLDTGRATHEQYKLIDKAFLHLEQLPIMYMEGSYDTRAIERSIEGTSPNGRRCGFWGLDHIGIVATEKSNGVDQRFGLVQTSKTFQAICHGIAPGMVLCQLNRNSLKKAADEIPNAGDFADSDQMYRDADVVIVGHRPEKDVQLSEEELEERRHRPRPEVAWVNPIKNRNGISGIPLQFAYDSAKTVWIDTSTAKRVV